MTRIKLVTSFYSDIGGFPYYGHTSKSRHERYLHSLRTLNNLEEELICYCNESQINLLKEYFRKYNLNNVKLKVSNISSYPFAEKMRRIKEGSEDFNFYHEVDWNKMYLLEKEYDEKYEFVYWIDVGISHRGLFLLKYNPFADKITGLAKDWENYSITGLFNSDLFPRINKWLGDSLINISHTHVRSNFEQINEIFNSNHQFESNTVGGILGGHISKMKWFIDDFKRNGKLCLDRNIILNHEQIISYMVKEYPQYFSTYVFNSWYHEDYWKTSLNFDRSFTNDKVHFVHFFQEELGIDPIDMSDFFDKVLHYYGRKNINLSVINIGALDGYQFDDMCGFIDMYNFEALYAEPIPEYFKKLKANMKGKSNRRFENAAISTYDGTITMTIIPPDIVEKGLVHSAFAGMSTIDPSKNGMGSDADKEVVDKYSEQVEVKCITLNTLFKKYDLDHFDVISMDTEGHDYVIFKQIDFDKYRPKLIRLEHINLTTTEKTEIENILSLNNYLFEYRNSQDLDAIPKEVYDEIYDYYMSDIGLISNQSEKELSALIHQNSRMNNGMTLVTGLWNIDRDTLKEGWSRSYDHYLSCLKDLLNVPYNIVVFGDEDVQELVSQIDHPERIYYIKRDKTWFENEFYSKIQTIRTTESWMNQVGWLSESCQAKLDLYNPIVMSKVFLLNDARILDPFDSSQMYWIDAGISNTVDLRYFSENRVLDILETNPKLSFVAFPYETKTEIHGFEFEAICKYSEAQVDKVCRGGFFGGPKEQISEFNALYYSLLNKTLNEGLMGTEESLFTILIYMYPNIFQYYLIQENGLLNTFFENLKNDEHVPFSTVLEFTNIDKEREAKIGLYIISFNSPRQLKSLVESMQNYDSNFLEVPELFLLDNSTMESTFKEYSEICDAYHINHIKKENLGICGGRQFIAEHAAAHDLDYYFFFEDDMFLAQEKSGLCSNGFPIFIDDLFINSLKIISNFQLDFLKLSYTEFFGNNSTQWAWYNVPQNIREEKWPNNSNLPKDGLALDPPRTIFNEIISHNGLSFATGEIYYCNWPQIVSKKGNLKMFLNQKWDRPYEQTWMSHIFQETLNGKIKPGLLMLSPIQHNRFEHYEAELRKES